MSEELLEAYSWPDEELDLLQESRSDGSKSTLKDTEIEKHKRFSLRAHLPKVPPYNKKKLNANLNREWRWSFCIFKYSASKAENKNTSY